jgi:hypothetical protein
MPAQSSTLRRQPVRCDACGGEVPLHQIKLRADRRRWLFYGLALLSMVLLWWLLMLLGVPGHVMQYGMFLVNLPAVVLVLLALRYPPVRRFTCPSCGTQGTQSVPVTRRRAAAPNEPAAASTVAPLTASPERGGEAR